MSTNRPIQIRSPSRKHDLESVNQDQDWVIEDAGTWVTDDCVISVKTASQPEWQHISLNRPMQLRSPLNKHDPESINQDQDWVTQELGRGWPMTALYPSRRQRARATNHRRHCTSPRPWVTWLLWFVFVALLLIKHRRPSHCNDCMICWPPVLPFCYLQWHFLACDQHPTSQLVNLRANLHFRFCSKFETLSKFHIFNCLFAYKFVLLFFVPNLKPFSKFVIFYLHANSHFHFSFQIWNIFELPYLKLFICVRIRTFIFHSTFEVQYLSQWAQYPSVQKWWNW